MRKITSAILTAAVLAAGVAGLSFPARADGGVKVGTLTCNVASGWGFIFGSSRSLKCTYEAKPGMEEHYTGRIAKFGVDIGYQQNGVIVWGVIAPTTDVAPGVLAGEYAGATASATIAAGLGANVLVGGSGKQIALQPVSIEGNQGLNIAAGLAEIHLRKAP